MNTLTYIVDRIKTTGIQVHTEQRENARGVVVTPLSFGINYEYCGKPFRESWEATATLSGSDVNDGTIGAVLRSITLAVEDDQTAEGVARDVSVGDWERVALQKGFAVFRSVITTRESAE